MTDLIVELNVAEIVLDIINELHNLNKNMIAKAVLGEKCGFEQKDGTFALYATQYEKLKDLRDKNFTQVPEWYWSMLEGQAKELFGKLAGKYLERTLDRFGNEIKN